MISNDVFKTPIKYMDELLKEIYNEHLGMVGEGHVADYIPELAAIDPNQYAIAVTTIDGQEYMIGDYETRFTIQSISKVFTLALLMKQMGEDIWHFVGREPSGTTFNSLIQIEQEKGIPRNPFINAGALVITDRIINYNSKPKHVILEFIRELAGSDDIYFDKTKALSEFDTSYTNRSLAYLIKSFGNIDNDIEEVLDVYCHQCSISMNVVELAKSSLFLANSGRNIYNGNQIISPTATKRINSLMLTCGLYNEAGEFAYRVGLPGKSGVGGGIVAILPGKLSIAVWSPELNKHGNSYRGISTLEAFATKLGISVF